MTVTVNYNNAVVEVTLDRWATVEQAVKEAGKTLTLPQWWKATAHVTQKNGLTLSWEAHVKKGATIYLCDNHL